MTRRSLAGFLAAPLLGADDPRDVIRKLAESLGDENEVRFTRLLDESAPRELIARAEALIRRNEVTSSIVILSEEGEGAMRRFRLDWGIDVRPRSFGGPFHRRRVATLVEVKLGAKGRWRITKIEPMAVLDSPPDPRS